MTHVTCREYRDNLVIIAEGHSCYGDRGSDIVCAGISVLVYTLINTLLDEEADEKINLVRSIVRDGYVYIEIKRYDFSRQRTDGIIDTFKTGLYMLSEAYPDFISID